MEILILKCRQEAGNNFNHDYYICLRELIHYKKLKEKIDLNVR